MKKIILLIVFALIFNMIGNARNYLNDKNAYNVNSDTETFTSVVFKENKISISVEKNSKNLDIQFTTGSKNIDSDICGRIAFIVSQVLKMFDFDNQTILYITLVVEQVCRSMI